MKAFTFNSWALKQNAWNIKSVSTFSGGIKFYASSRSTAIVHSPISAAAAPIAAKTGNNTAPTTPIVSGKDIISLPVLS